MIPTDAAMAQLLFKLIPILEKASGLKAGSAVATPSAWYLFRERFSLKITYSATAERKLPPPVVTRSLGPGTTMTMTSTTVAGGGSGGSQSGSTLVATGGSGGSGGGQSGQTGVASQSSTLVPFYNITLTPTRKGALRVLPYVPSKPGGASGWQLTHCVSVFSEEDFPAVLKAVDVAKEKRAVARAYRREQEK